MVTCTTYSNLHNYTITVVINGNTPAQLTLVDIDIKYPDCEVIYPLIYPTFSLTFLGNKNIYEQFGAISHNSHSIRISSSRGDLFLGFLTPEIFQMPNTGFEEKFTINAVHRIEYLKRLPFNFDDYDAVTNLNNIISDIVLTYGSYLPNGLEKSFSDNMPDIMTGNFVKDDGEYTNLYTVLEMIMTAFNFKLFVNLDNSTTIISLAKLANKGGDDYYGKTHLGYDETFSAGEIYDKASVLASDYEQQQIPVDFDIKLAENRSDMIAGQGREVFHFIATFYGKWGKLNFYERYISFYRENESPWHFPKYLSPTQPVDEYDENQIFQNGIPILGAYPIAYRVYNPDKPDLSVPLTTALMIKVSRNGSYSPGEFNVMNYINSNFIADDKTFLFFTFNYGWTNYMGTNWNEDGGNGEWSPHYRVTEGTMDTCPVPISPHHSGLSYNISLYLKFEIIFKGKYWNNTTRTWGTTPARFSLFSDKPVLKNTGRGECENSPAPDNIPFYENVKGNWISFKDNPGIGEININVYASDREGATRLGYLFLYDFNIKLLTQNTAQDSLNIKKDTVYANTSTSNFEYPKITVFLTSKNESKLSRSKLMDGDEFVDKLNYNSDGLSVSEKPEEHIIRMITQYVSAIKSISDIIDINDFRWTCNYNSNKLWCNSLDYKIIDDVIKPKYYYNNINYQPL